METTKYNGSRKDDRSLTRNLERREANINHPTSCSNFVAVYCKIFPGPSGRRTTRLGSLALCIVEVGRDSDDGLAHVS